jgi:phage terminase small subunit
MNSQERLFVDYFLATDNPIGSAHLAGFEGNGDAHRVIAATLLQRPDVIQEIRNRREGLALPMAGIVDRLAEIATGSLDYFVSPGPDGSTVVDLEKARKAGKMGLVRSVSWSAGAFKIELHDPIKAMELLLGCYGVTTEENSPSGEGNVSRGGEEPPFGLS